MFLEELCQERHDSKMNEGLLQKLGRDVVDVFYGLCCLRRPRDSDGLCDQLIINVVLNTYFAIPAGGG